MRQDNIILEQIYKNMYSSTQVVEESFNYVSHAEEVLNLAMNRIQEGLNQANIEVREKGQPLFSEILTSYTKEADSLTRVAVLLKDGKIEKAKSAIKGLKKDLKDILPSHILNLSSTSEEIVPTEEIPVETSGEPDFGDMEDMEDMGEDNTDAI
jgi:hypothetical protein